MAHTVRRLMSNPYHFADGNDLAGACAESDAGGTGSAPHRRHIGAERASVAAHKHHPKTVDAVPHFKWSFGVDPVEVHTDATDDAYYDQRVRHHEVFDADSDGGAPLEKLARSRRHLMAKHKADYGVDIDTSGWAEQFPLDEQVKEIQEALSPVFEAEAKAAETKKAEAKAKAEEGAAKPLSAEQVKEASDKRKAAIVAAAKKAAGLGTPETAPTATPPPIEAAPTAKAPKPSFAPASPPPSLATTSDVVSDKKGS